jgi:hypothetical protein
MSGDEEFESAEEEAEFSETPDWLAALEPSGVSSEVSGSAADENEAVAAEADDWMSELQTPASEVAAPSAADADFEWLAADAVSDELEAEPEPEAEAATPASGEPDWLGAMNLTPQEAEPELAEAEITWTSDELQPPVAEPAAADLDWLNELEPASEPDADEFTADEIEPAEEFSWLDEAEFPEAPEAEAEAEADAAAEVSEAPEPVMAVPEAEAQPEAPEPVMAVPEEAPVIGSEAFEADELAPVSEVEDEILEPTPAQNAPDWLNAMVPGLDVDYEAGGEAAAEEEAEEPASAPAAKREFGWLVEIVEEETAASERAHFVFSRPPVWLQHTNGAAHGEAVKDDLPDWPSDDADADVPEWLR